ncbi:MAG: TIGR04372 family glycosyltransferase [Roseburia sp.]|nr:TIGR04372 family glycosyltransferase [Roseburia sp.]
MNYSKLLHKCGKRINYKFARLGDLIQNLPMLIKFHDVVPYLMSRPNRAVVDTFIKDMAGMHVNKRENFQKRYSEIHSRYEKIIFGQYFMRHVGEMCLTYYLWRIENKGQEKLLYVMAPVLLDDSYDKIPNNYFFNKIQEDIEIIQQDNYEFWCWMLRHHRKEVEFTDRYSWDEMRKRDMAYINVSKDFFQVCLEPKDQTFLKQMEIGDEFICIYNRDSAYYRAMGITGNAVSTRPSERDSSVSDYNLLSKEFKARGISSVRMGYQVAEKAETEDIIDYASKYRTERLDFYLISKCKFFVVSNSGIMVIAKLFTTPLVVVNAVVLSFGGDIVEPMTPQKDLILLKKFWYTKQDRYLSLDEILYMEGKYKSYEVFDAYRSLGIVFQSNSQEELLDIANEMLKRLEGKQVYTEEDERLQERYRSILERNVKSSGNHYYNGRYGAKFLRQNPWFLEDVDEELSIKNIELK